MFKLPVGPRLSSEAQQILMEVATKNAELFLNTFELYLEVTGRMDNFIREFEKEVGLAFGEVEEKAAIMRELQTWGDEIVYRLRGKSLRQSAEKSLRAYDYIISPNLDAEILARMGISHKSEILTNPYTYSPSTPEEVYTFLVTMTREDGNLLFVWNTYYEVLDFLCKCDPKSKTLKKLKKIHLYLLEDKVVHGETVASPMIRFNDAVHEIQRKLALFNDAAGINRSWMEAILKDIDLTNLPGEDEES